MKQGLLGLLLLLAGLLSSGARPAQAHPHVWITATSELVYAPDGAITGVRHAWTFDDMFSTYALQGLETKAKGVYSREELAPLAQTNVESLKEFAYFTFAKADGKKEKFQEPVDYFLEYKEAALTLHFMLPLKTPVKTKSLVAGSVRPLVFHRLQIRRQGPDQAGRGARRLPDEIPAAERRHRRRAEAQRAEFRQRRQLELRRDVRQQDHGGMPVRPEFSHWPRPRAHVLRRGGGRGSDARWRHACPAGADAVRGAAAAPPRRRPAASSAGSWRNNRNFTARCPRPSAPPSPTAARSGHCLRYPSPTAIFHAAGPGHGKAVISSYLVANQETARRGIALSFASALMQSLVAVLIVGVCAWLLNATAKTMCGAERAIEIGSYALIASSAPGWSGPRAADSCARCRRATRCLRWPGAAHTIMVTHHHHDHATPPPRS